MKLGDLLRLQYLTWPIFSPSKSDGAHQRQTKPFGNSKGQWSKPMRDFPLNPGCLIEILMVVYNPHITCMGSIIPCLPQTHRHMFFSLLRWNRLEKNWKQRSPRFAESETEASTRDWNKTYRSQNFPTYPWNIPQTPNQRFMKEFLSFGGLGIPGVCSKGMLGFS